MVKIIGLSGFAGSGKDHIANILVKEFSFVKIAFADEIKRTAQRWYDFSYDQLWGPSELRNKTDKRYIRLTKEQCEKFNDGISAWHQTETNQSVYEWLGLTLEEYKDFVEHGVVYLSVRYALQQLGTQAGRSFYENTWVDIVLRQTDQIFFSTHLATYTPEIGVVTSLSSHPGYQRISRVAGVVIPDVRFANEMQALGKKGGKVVRIKRNKATTLSGAATQHASETEQQAIPDSSFDHNFHNVEDPDILMKSIHEMMSKLNATS